MKLRQLDKSARKVEGFCLDNVRSRTRVPHICILYCVCVCVFSARFGRCGFTFRRLWQFVRGGDDRVIFWRFDYLVFDVCFFHISVSDGD